MKPHFNCYDIRFHRRLPKLLPHQRIKVKKKQIYAHTYAVQHKDIGSIVSFFASSHLLIAQWDRINFELLFESLFTYLQSYTFFDQLDP